MYNTQRKHLVIREYGRNTQELIQHAKTLENREMRQEYVERIVELILSMNPGTRNVADFRLKVWAHVLEIANYELDIDLPDNIPEKKKLEKPEPLAYPNLNRRLRHYGQHVKTMINKAKTMEDKEKQEAYLQSIASYMKLCYKAWNRENMSNEIIHEEFKILSKGELTLPDNLDLNTLMNTRKRKAAPYSSSNQRRNNYKGTRTKRK